MVAFAVPNFIQTMQNYRIAGDAMSINGEIGLAKMRAAARFTQVRVRFDGAGVRTVRTEWWSRFDNRGWVPEAVGAPQTLSSGVNFGALMMAAPPVGSDQTVWAPPPPCMTGNVGNPDRPAAPWEGAVIANTACVVFNSRGFPINNTLGPTGDYGVYINNGEDVQGVTITASALTQVWRNDTAGTTANNWIQR